MKTSIIIFAAATFALTGSAFAQTASNTSASGSNASIYNQSHNPKQAPGAIAPGLAASGATCLGSTSFGGSFSGFGLSFGSTHAERYCNAREDAKYIQGITGNNYAAKERLCDTPENAAAFARAGQPCVNRGGVSNVSYASAGGGVQNMAPAQRKGAVVKSFRNLKECRQWLAANPSSGIACKAR